MKTVYFTPGPSELYYTVESHLKAGLRSHVASINHRSSTFMEIHKRVVGNLTKLLSLPDDYQVYFTSSATEIWERLVQNCVIKNSTHLVNGAFSERFYKTSLSFHKNASKLQKPLGEGFNIETVELEKNTELLAFIHNETSTGVTSSLEGLKNFKKRYPDVLIAVDAVSSLPYPALDYHNLDSVYFSVQKGFGLPAGLGVWMVNQFCIDKCEKMKSAGLLNGLSNTLLNFSKNFIKHQTPYTPNILTIYLLEKVTEDMLTKGIEMIRKETGYKAAVLYHAINQNPHLEIFVKNENYRSKTVIVATTQGNSEDLTNYLSQKGMVIGQGYGENKKNQIRISNFPTHSKEMVEKLADIIVEFRFG